MNSYWEVRRGGKVIGHGSEPTLPDKWLRKELRANGYRIYVEGKLFRE